jgi:arabinofuranosyltransferase
VTAASAAPSVAPGDAGGAPLDDAFMVTAAAVVLAGFLAAELRIAGAVGLPLDDAWIHLRFAENLAAGRGFAINPGVPVAGSTAPLWTALLALPLAVGVPGLLAAKLLGVTAYLLTALATRRLALALGLSRALALAAGLGAVAAGPLAWGALSGMEVCLAAAGVAGGALLAARERPLAATAALAAATLARPEAALVLVLHVAGAGGLRPAAGRAGVAIVMGGPALAFNLAIGGRLVPATAVAKVEGGVLGRLVGLHEAPGAAGLRVLEYAGEWARFLVNDHVALPLLGLVGLAVLRRSRIRWLPWALVLHPIAMALVAPYRGPAFQTGRYSAHLLPLAVVVGAAGLGAVLDRLPGRLRVVTLAAAALGLVLPLRPASETYAWGVQNINAMQVRLGRFVAGATPPDAVVAVNDVGALSYFGGRPIIDLMGLVTPDIVPARREGEAGILRYLERRCPDYLVIFPAWFPTLAARADLFRPIERVRLPHNVVSGADEMVVYETAWSRFSRPPGTCPGHRAGARP